MADPSILDNLPVTILYVDNATRGADQVFVQIGHVTEPVMNALSEEWKALWNRYHRPLSAPVARLAAELAITPPVAAPLWDKTYLGTYKQWLDVSESIDEATRDYEENLATALDEARTTLILNAGFVPASESFLFAAGPWNDGAFVFSNDIGASLGNGWRRLHVRDARVLTAPLDCDDLTEVLARAIKAGTTAYAAARHENITGVITMTLQDLMESYPSEDSEGLDAQDLLNLFYPEWEQEAQRRRASIRNAVERGAPGIWNKFENLTNEGLPFVEIPEEAQQDAETAELRRSGVATLPPAVADTLIARARVLLEGTN